jgi:predicted Rossmann-fold nucleotide-binding protein
MGAVAKGVTENGGSGIGVVPEPLFKQGSKQICEAVIVPDMHARKKRMAEEVKQYMQKGIKKEGINNVN